MDMQVSIDKYISRRVDLTTSMLDEIASKAVYKIEDRDW